MRRRLVTGLALCGVCSVAATSGTAQGRTVAAPAPATPIKHVVVIFGENISFDHYFGTYGQAGTPGIPANPAVPNNPHPQIPTPPVYVNGLANTPGLGGTGTLLTNNPNKDSGGVQVNPRRFDPTNINDILTCDQDHNYTDEQKAFNAGAMDKFVTAVGASGTAPTGATCSKNDVMNYYDGATVTGLWNYAKQFAMSDNSFGTTFGPSAPGAINLVSGNTGAVNTTVFADPGGTAGNNPFLNGDTVSDGSGATSNNYSLIEDAQPYYDDCSTRDAVTLTGKNIGDLLNAKGLSWGWFQGGFRPSTSFATANANTALGGTNHATSLFVPDEFSGKYNVAPATNQGLCNTVHPIGPAVGGTGGTGPMTTTAAPNTNYGNKDDYIPHHEPFQYYPSTANPHHLPPASTSAIGTDTQTTTAGVPQWDTANHQYDMSDFDTLVGAINHGYLTPDHLPAVSFLKAPGYQDAHAQYSNPLDEQQFIVKEINALERTPDWSSTMVVLAYDDSDGWYDHVFSGVANPSHTAASAPGPQDFLNATGVCTGTNFNPALAGQNGRCGYGPRLPLLIVSPLARKGVVDHTLTDQSSIIRFVEDNWGLGRIPGSFDAIAGSLMPMLDAGDPTNPPLFLDEVTGQKIAWPAVTGQSTKK